MPVRFLAGVTQAVMAPERPFAARSTPRFSLFALMALLLAATVAGETMILWHLRHPVLRQIALVEARHVAEQRALSFADPEEVERIQAAAYRRLTAPSGAAAKTAAVLLSGLVLPAAVVLTWLALLVLAQFFGGEERRLPDRPRASIHLVATAFVPLALRRLLAGGVTLTTDPLAAANVTTVAAYREHTIARFRPGGAGALGAARLRRARCFPCLPIRSDCGRWRCSPPGARRCCGCRPRARWP